MDFEEKKLSSQLIYKGKILSLYVDEVLLPDGKTSHRECVRHSGGAAVLFVSGGKVALVKQFRYLYGKCLYEIPAGKIERGEDALLSAQRELREETGYKANVTHFMDIYPTPGYTDEIIHIYLATEGEQVGARLDEGEFLNCEFFPISDVLAMIERGEITDAKTVAAIYKYMYKFHI